MKKQDLSYLARQGLIDAGVGRGEVLVLAISGGPDSMALLDIFRRLAPRAGWGLVVAHIDHGLRRTSGRDAKLVADYCQGHRLTCIVRKIVLPTRIRQSQTRVEEVARELRYRALRDIAKAAGARWIVTAHNADDQVETIILNFLRGSGVRGLGGMRLVSGDIIRPWLVVSKNELLGYVRKHKVPFVIDATNALTRFTRNRVRHKLLPVLRTYNPQLDELLLKNSQLFRQADIVLTELAYRTLGLIGREVSGKVNISISKLVELLPLMQVEVIKAAMIKVAGSAYQLTGAHFREVMKLVVGPANSGTKRLPGKLVATRSRDTITISQE